MSELLARTLARALPLFARRWQDETRERGLPEHSDAHSGRCRGHCSLMPRGVANIVRLSQQFGAMAR